MIELTEQQSQQLHETEPIVIDPITKETYVLVRKAVYDRIKALIHDDGEWTDAELRLALARSAEANGWNEPAMDEYDQYDDKRASRCP